MKKIILTLWATIAITATCLAQQKQPNVVVFLVDDLRIELGCYGSKLAQTPNIDKLADEGVKFNKAYCQQAICAPSRMSILTGLRPETIGIYSIFTPLRKHNKEVVSMPQFFKENGYKTVSIGKVYHHGRDDTQYWTDYFPKEGNSYLKPENIAIVERLKKEGSKSTKGPAFEDADVEDEGYKDGRAAKNAIETLHKLKDEKFLMFVGLSKPHLPFNAPKKYWDLYDKQAFEVPSREKPEAMYRLALSKWGELKGYYGIPNEGDLDDDLTKDLIHGYHASVSYIDAQMGKVMKTLEELDLRKNTIVILMSDHGYKIGEYGAWCKHSNAEIDVRVPMIVSRETGYENRVAGASSDALVENVDLFPTLVEACGLEGPPSDGKSILSVVDNPKKKWDEGAYSVYPRGRNIMGCTTTDGEWRYTEWRNSDTQEVEAAELYKHKNNKLIANENLAGNKKYNKVEQRMKSLLEKQFPSDRQSFYPEKVKE